MCKQVNALSKIQNLESLFIKHPHTHTHIRIYAHMNISSSLSISMCTDIMNCLDCLSPFVSMGNCSGQFF